MLSSIWRWFALGLIERAKRTPYYHLPNYMDRFWLVPYREDKGAGTGPVKFRERPLAWLIQVVVRVAIRAHHIKRSDNDRHPHDHPWWYLTVILFGGYTEYRYDAMGVLQSVKWHGPGSVLIRPYGSWHRLEVKPNTPCWTLFITGRYRDTWGFNVDGVKIPHGEYNSRNA